MSDNYEDLVSEFLDRIIRSFVTVRNHPGLWSIRDTDISEQESNRCTLTFELVPMLGKPNVIISEISMTPKDLLDLVLFKGNEKTYKDDDGEGITIHFLRREYPSVSFAA